MNVTLIIMGIVIIILGVIKFILELKSLKALEEKYSSSKIIGEGRFDLKRS